MEEIVHMFTFDKYHRHKFQNQTINLLLENMCQAELTDWIRSSIEVAFAHTPIRMLECSKEALKYFKNHNRTPYICFNTLLIGRKPSRWRGFFMVLRDSVDYAQRVTTRIQNYLIRRNALCLTKNTTRYCNKKYLTFINRPTQNFSICMPDERKVSHLLL